jgi:hypothetical protein
MTVTRNRMGRMNTFMARILKDIDAVPPSTVHAVGIDEQTALLLNIYTGEANAVGFGTAYVCASKRTAAVCEPNTPLTFKGIQCTRLNALNNDSFSFATYSGKGIGYTNSILQGAFVNYQYGPYTTYPEPTTSTASRHTSFILFSMLFTVMLSMGMAMILA